MGWLPCRWRTGGIIVAAFPACLAATDVALSALRSPFCATPAAAATGTCSIRGDARDIHHGLPMKPGVAAWKPGVASWKPGVAADGRSLAARRGAARPGGDPSGFSVLPAA